MKKINFARSLPALLAAFWRENGGSWFGALIAVSTVTLALGAAWVSLRWGAYWWVQLIGAVEWSLMIAMPVGLVVYIAIEVADKFWAYRWARATVWCSVLVFITGAYGLVMLWGAYPWVQSLGAAIWGLGALAQILLVYSSRARDFLWGDQPIG